MRNSALCVNSMLSTHVHFSFPFDRSGRTSRRDCCIPFETCAQPWACSQGAIFQTSSPHPKSLVKQRPVRSWLGLLMSPPQLCPGHCRGGTGWFLSTTIFKKVSCSAWKTQICQVTVQKSVSLSLGLFFFLLAALTVSAADRLRARACDMGFFIWESQERSRWVTGISTLASTVLLGSDQGL